MQKSFGAGQFCRKVVSPTTTSRRSTVQSPGYKYTYVNDRPVLVEPRSRRIVEIID